MTGNDAEPAERRRYLEQLRASLGVRNAPQARVEEIVTEVEGHLLASGDDPRSELGPPWELADQLLAAKPVPKPSRAPVSMAAVAVCAVLGPILLIDGVVALTTGDPAVFRVSDLVSAALLLGGIGAGIPLVEAVLEGRRSRWWLVAAVSAALVVIVAIRTLWDAPVLYEGSAWFPAAAGAVMLVGLAFLINRQVRRLTPVEPAYQDADHGAADRPPPPRRRQPAQPPSGPVRRILDTPVMKDTSPGVRIVVVSLIIAAAALGGWLLAAEGPALPPVITLLFGLGLGLLIGDGVGARRVRRAHGLPSPTSARHDGPNTA